MKAFIQHLIKHLSPFEIFIGLFSFIVGGIGIIFIILKIWKFLIHVLGG